MIVRKTWTKPRFEGGFYLYEYEGWFLFGFIPVYIVRRER